MADFASGDSFVLNECLSTPEEEVNLTTEQDLSEIDEDYEVNDDLSFLDEPNADESEETDEINTETSDEFTNNLNFDDWDGTDCLDNTPDSFDDLCDPFDDTDNWLSESDNRQTFNEALGNLSEDEQEEIRRFNEEQEEEKRKLDDLFGHIQPGNGIFNNYFETQTACRLTAVTELAKFGQGCFSDKQKDTILDLIFMCMTSSFEK